MTDEPYNGQRIVSSLYGMRIIVELPYGSLSARRMRAACNMIRLWQESFLGKLNVASNMTAQIPVRSKSNDHEKNADI